MYVIQDESLVTTRFFCLFNATDQAAATATMADQLRLPDIITRK